MLDGGPQCGVSASLVNVWDNFRLNPKGGLCHRCLSRAGACQLWEQLQGGTPGPGCFCSREAVGGWHIRHVRGRTPSGGAKTRKLTNPRLPWGFEPAASRVRGLLILSHFVPVVMVFAFYWLNGFTVI